MEGENQMSDTSETVTYHLSVLVIVDGGMRSNEIDLDLPLTEEGALSIAAAFADALPPAPATQITITRYDRATVQSYGNLGAIPPVFE
jgi:hypothetical protein